MSPILDLSHPSFVDPLRLILSPHNFWNLFKLWFFLIVPFILHLLTGLLSEELFFISQSFSFPGGRQDQCFICMDWEPESCLYILSHSRICIWKAPCFPIHRLFREPHILSRTEWYLEIIIWQLALKIRSKLSLFLVLSNAQCMFFHFK